MSPTNSKTRETYTLQGCIFSYLRETVNWNWNTMYLHIVQYIATLFKECFQNFQKDCAQGMVVCLRLALAHVTYDTPSIRFHLFLSSSFFFFSFFPWTTLCFCYKNQNICLAMIWSKSDKKAGFQSKLYNVAMISCWWVVSGLIVGPLIFFGLY